MTESSRNAVEPASGIPLWLVAATAAMALLILLLAVAETSITVAWLVDTRGEFLSLFGLAFILVAGLALWRQGRLAASLPLTLPWLLYPIVTQGDQIIDYLSIGWMRAVVHVLLAAIFAAPVAVVVMAVRHFAEPRPGRTRAARPWMALLPGLRQMVEGRRREGAAVLATALLVLEMYLANAYLGTLMVATLVVMTLGVLMYGAIPEEPVADVPAQRRRSERFAVGVLLAGVLVSGATYLGYRHAPGAYQGSPSFFMDPAKQDTNFRVDRIPLPTGPVSVPSQPETVGDALVASARTLEQLLAGYHILERNYTWDYHNELFIRQQLLVPNYRATGLQLVAEARTLRTDADAKIVRARESVADTDPLAGLLDDLKAYLAFQFDRAPVLETMSAGFQQTRAGLQHAAHLYEGEAKYVGSGLADILTKHQRALTAPALAPVVGEFSQISHSVYEAYATHIVGY